jgi:uncharacterized protein DUF2017
MSWLRRIERTRGGEFRLRLTRRERALLRSLAAELRARLDEDAGDPALRRLFPPAYEDAEAQSEYSRLTGDDLLAGRREALRLLEDAPDRLDEPQLYTWLRGLNDLRLVLGTRLDVTEDTFDEGIDVTKPRGRDLAVYAYLSWLEEQAVEALASA